MAGYVPSGRPAQVHGRWLLLQGQHEPCPTSQRPDISCPTRVSPSDISAPSWEGGNTGEQWDKRDRGTWYQRNEGSPLLPECQIKVFFSGLLNTEINIYYC